MVHILTLIKSKNVESFVSFLNFLKSSVAKDITAILEDSSHSFMNEASIGIMYIENKTDVAQLPLY